MNELKLLGVTLLIAILQTTALICQPNFTIGSASGDKNDVVTIELRVSDFTDLVGVEFALEWDASVAEFVSFDNVNGAITNFASAAPPAIADGKINFLWFGSSVTLPENDIFYTVDLRLVGDPGSSTTVDMIAVTGGADGVPFAIPASDPTSTIDVTFSQGIVSVMGEGGSDPTLTMGSQNVQPGDEFCLGVTVRDFNAVMALQFDINWDSDVLEFTSIDNLNLPDLGTEDFNLSGAPSGEVRMAWVTGMAGGGNTLANGTSIFDICYTAIGASGTSSNVEISDLISVPIFTTVDGTVDIQGGDITGFALIASDGSGSPGQQICSDISVNGFTDIQAIQFSMEWNPLQFSFDTAVNLNTILGSNLNIGDPTREDVDPGTLTVAWFSNGGATLTDGDILFTLCLNAPTDCDANIPIRLTDSPVDIIIVTRIDGQLPDNEVTLIDGMMTVDCAVNVVLDDLNHPTCNGDETGSILVSVLPADGDYSFTWNGQGSTSEDLENIGAGTYTLNVTDNATGAMMSIEYTLTDPTAIEIDGTSQDPSNAGADGSITINGVSGGTGVLTCLWNPDISTDCSGADGLAARAYNLTVVDESDCMVSETFQLTGSGSTLAIVSNTSSATCATVDNCDGSISVDIETGQGQFVMTIDGQIFEGTVTNLCPGDYQIEVMDQGLNQTVTETVTVGGPDVIQCFVSITPVSDISAMDGQAIVTNITGGSGVYDIIWQSTDSDTLSNVPIGPYLLTIIDSDGCEVQKMVVISDTLPVSCFIGASLITPNSDGKNDEFVISCSQSRANEIRIFNRWGQLVHQQTNYDNTWDGTDISGNKLLDDVYFWVLSVQIDDGSRRDIQGYVSLIRNLN